MSDLPRYFAMLSVIALVVIGVIFVYRKAAECDADAALDHATEQWKKGLAKVPTPPIDAMWPEIEAKLYPRYDYALDLPLGTRACPVYSSLGHPAYAATVADLLADCGIRE